MKVKFNNTVDIFRETLILRGVIKKVAEGEREQRELFSTITTEDLQLLLARSCGCNNYNELLLGASPTPPNYNELSIDDFFEFRGVQGLWLSDLLFRKGFKPEKAEELGSQATFRMYFDDAQKLKLINNSKNKSSNDE